MTEKTFIFDSPITNDKIDIYDKVDVSIKKVQSKNKKEFIADIEGYNIDYSIVNALRRTILMSIPIYGFHRSNTYIDVEKSRHMYNNDLLYNQIETLPIYDIPNYFDLEDPELYLPTEVMKKLFSNFLPPKFSEARNKDELDEDKVADAEKKLFQIEFSINYKNTGSTDKFVNTHDGVIKVNGKVSSSYLDNPYASIIVLKPGEEIFLRTEANLGISKIYATYEATTNAYYIELSSTKYQLYYETLGQLDKYIIFTKSCVILIKKLENLKKFIEETYEEQDVSEIIEIHLFGEDHTIGNLFAITLQKCVNVEKAGYGMPHPFIDQIIITYKLMPKSKVKPIKLFVDTADYLIKIFTKLLEQANKFKSN